MWCISTKNKTLKTFKIQKIVDFVLSENIEEPKFYINYHEVSKDVFLKRVMQVTNSWTTYIEMEKKLISKESKELWEKIIKPLKN